jgi:tetratricopeptide (TPR) repeat protein
VRRTLSSLGLAALIAAALLVSGAQDTVSREERLTRLRNLGKAFYENPTTQAEAVETFRQALELNESPRERLNYGLALLRAGKTEQAVTELERVQKQDPSLPHTWFNLGIVFRKNGEFDKATVQFERMVALRPEEAVPHYNLGVLYRMARKMDAAIAEFQTAIRLDHNLAAPHFQLFNAYRQAKQMDVAQRELDTFSALKKAHEGAAVPEDMEWCDYAEVYDPIEPHAAAVAAPTGMAFDDVKLAATVDAATAGLVAFDADGDGAAEVLAWSRRGVVLLGWGASKPLAHARGSVPSVPAVISQPALESLRGVLAVAPADFNNDGFIDLCVLTTSGARLFRNEQGRFVAHTAGLPEGRFEAAVWMDYDHDYDLDLVLLGERGVVLRNQGTSGFHEMAGALPFAAGAATGAQVFRAVADTKGMDLLVTYRDRAAVLYRDKLGGLFEAVEVAALPGGVRDVQAGDVDGDGQVDIAYRTADGIGWLRNRRGGFERGGTVPGASGPFVLADLANRGVFDLVSAAGVAVGGGRGQFTLLGPSRRDTAAWAAGDFEGKGTVGLVSVAADGTLHRLTPKAAGGGIGHWITVKLVGVKNTILAAGAEVEIKAGPVYQKQTYTGAAPLRFGLDGQTQVDTVRITWPNGLIQNEMRQGAGAVHTYKEAQRLSGSCPMIWTWNGREFEYITDVLGVAPLGASAGDGGYFPVDHDEYVQIPGRALSLRDGRYEVRVTEELSEVSYLDHVRLIALDHPAEVDVFTNDKFKSPPFPEFRLFGVRSRRYPVAARDDAGRDVRAALLAHDRRYVDTFERTAAGASRLHTLALDFGRDAARDNRAVLLLNGWVDWAEGSTFLGAAQERAGGLKMPYLQVKDAGGQWRTVVDDMGMPSGKPKTIAVDLAGKFLSASREVRIVTGLCVFWDEIFLGEDSGTTPARLTALDPAAASLGFRGFSRNTVDPRRRQPETFSYPDPEPVSLWNPTPGMYTRYGDVRTLAAATDDRMVIMGSGDELRLEFDAAGLPALESGWQRDFLLMVDGWAKDRDANTAFSQTVEPLPFHGMSGYPYAPGERYPDTAELRRYREQYNTRPALELIRPLTSRLGKGR